MRKLRCAQVGADFPVADRHLRLRTRMPLPAISPAARRRGSRRERVGRTTARGFPAALRPDVPYCGAHRTPRERSCSPWYACSIPCSKPLLSPWLPSLFPALPTVHQQRLWPGIRRGSEIIRASSPWVPTVRDPVGLGPRGAPIPGASAAQLDWRETSRRQRKIARRARGNWCRWSPTTAAGFRWPAPGLLGRASRPVGALGIPLAPRCDFPWPPPAGIAQQAPTWPASAAGLTARSALCHRRLPLTGWCARGGLAAALRHPLVP